MTFTIFDRLHTYCNDEMSAATYNYSVARPKMIQISTSIQKNVKKQFLNMLSTKLPEENVNCLKSIEVN